MTIGTFEGGARESAHPSLVRTPYIDLTRQPTDEAEQRAYETYRFTRTFDANGARGFVSMGNGARKRSIPSAD